MRLAITIILTILGLSAKAQTNFLSQYNSTTVGLAHGLPGNYIDDMLTDSNGFVWIATYGSGLVRYDGYSCVPLPTIDSADRLGSYSCKTICEDRHKRIWVAFDEGVRVIDMNTLLPITPTYKGKPISNILDEPAVRVATDSNGNIWIVTRAYIYYIKIDQDGNISNIASTPYVSRAPTIAIEDIDGNGTMWAAIDGNVMVLSPQGNTISKKEAAPALRNIGMDFVTDIKKFNGNVWIATNVGLYRYASTGDLHRYAAPVISHGFATCLAPLGKEKLLVGTLGGVNIYDTKSDSFESWLSRNNTGSLPSDFINCIMIQGRQIWIGTETGGIAKLTPRVLKISSWVHTADPTTISGNPVNSIYVEDNGTLWVGTVDGGLNRRAAGQSAFTHFTTANSSLSHNTVSTLTADANKRLWIGTWGGGVCQLDMGNPQTIAQLTVDPVHQGLLNCVGALAYDPVNKGLWIGSNEGIFYYDYGSKRIYEPFDGCRNARGAIGSIIERDGTLWMGCLEGVYEINTKKHDPNFSHFAYTHHKYKLDAPESKIVEKISCFCITKAGELWLGSNEYGLYKRVTSKDGKTTFKAYTKADGLTNNSVKGIAEDNNGRLWITTINGLSCLNESTGMFTNFGKDDGLVSEQFYWNSAIRGSDGTIYLGSDGGLNELKGINNATGYEGKLRFTKITIDNIQVFAGSEFLDDDISVAKELHMDEGTKSIEIEFSSLNYRNERGETYSYRMKGFEKDWHMLSAGAHAVRYTNLPSGDYTFEVRHNSSPDISSEEVISLNIYVKPFFWKSKIFVLLLIAAVVALSAWLYKRKLAAVRRSEAETLMRPIEEALENFETPAKMRERIESILKNQRRYDESSQISAEVDNEQQQTFMDKLIAVVEKNYKNSEFGVTEMSEQMGINRSVLSKQIAKETGLSSSQFLKNYRLSIAHRLLTSSTNTRNVTEIAFAVGFNDPKYFTRCFAAEYGVSPSSLLNYDTTTIDKGQRNGDKV